MKKFNKNYIATFLAIFMFSLPGLVVAATALDFGAANSFSVLAGSTITNTGSTVINGDLGLSPGTSVTGFPPGIVNGAQHITDSAAANAQIALTAALNNAAGQSATSTIPAELGGTTKTPGVYDSNDGTFKITGTLTLDAAGDPNAVFIFKAGTTLTTAGASNIVLINGAQACNVFWQVDSSATLGVNSTFKGNILALTSVTLTTGANVEGSIFASVGAVTIDSNTITKATCAAVITPVATTTPIVIIPVVITPTPTSTPVVITQSPTSTPVVITQAPTSTPVVITPILTSTPTSTPALPNTGINPNQKNIPWKIIIPASIFTISIFLFIVRRKQII